MGGCETVGGNADADADDPFDFASEDVVGPAGAGLMAASSASATVTAEIQNRLGSLRRLSRHANSAAAAAFKGIFNELFVIVFVASQ